MYRNLIAFLAAALILAIIGASTSAAIPVAPDTVTVFVDVHVIPMDEERVLENRTVIVRGDRIDSVVPAGSAVIPAGAVVIEGDGRYLMPGLAEMHGHVPPPSGPRREVENTLFLYAAGGVTTVRGMLGWPGQLELRSQAEQGEIVSPTLYLAGPSFNGNSISSPEQAAARAREQAAAGWDLLKVHPGLTRAEYDAMADAAHDVGIAFGGHVPADVGLLHALEKRQLTFDHIDGYTALLGGEDGTIDRDALADVVRQTREAGAWIVPTLLLWESILGAADLEAMQAYEELRYVSPAQVRQWTNSVRSATSSPGYNAVEAMNITEARLEILQALHEGGVPILMGTDAPQIFSVPGFSLHREVVRMTDAGMSPFEV
ncbi:MAG: amidohydrolase family protein, partial [Rhodothermales bacterium]|nr:amidohydrolase family protein [Rhodothermales bacterium]